jgi:hypothetical protein
MQVHDAVKLAVAILGAVTGTIALGWRVIDEFGSFLRIGLKVEEPKDSWTTILTTVDNKGIRPKKISYAVILIGPEAENPIESARILAKKVGHEKTINYTNDLEEFVITSTVIEGDRLIIPVPFYYLESVDIADETITYRVPLNIDALTKGVPLAVRFFVFASGRLHRSTQDSFIVLPVANELHRT